MLCFSQIRPLVCVGGANEGKRSPQMFCLDTAKKTRFHASDRKIVVAFFSPGGWKTVLLCCPRPSGAIGRSGCGKTGKWSPRHILFLLRCRKRIRLGKTPGPPAHKISTRVFFPQAIGQLVWKICPFNEHISSFKLYNYVYMQYYYRFELARQRVGALSMSSGEKICPVFLHPIETLERENGTAGWQLA